jgi:hypothetical protein
MRTNSTPDAIDVSTLDFHLRCPDYYRTAVQTQSLVAMALIDKVPGDLNLYIGGYVMQSTVSKFPHSGVCDN